ncbi:hypothetical protein BJX61DRAFT_150634 [Aspergillus egyptiacus]|nr:hypothetical protein BJX61DRAFT_150634 [Aspergillus egyptiacus]
MGSHLTIRGTFSSFLRDRSIWQVIGPILTASAGSLEECASQTSDFSFGQETDSRSLKVILLSPSSLEDNERQCTVLRLKRLVTSDSPFSRKAIAFLLSEDAFASASEKYSMSGLLALQVLLFECLATCLAVIPIADAPSILSSMQEYVANLEDIPPTSSSFGDSITLLAHGTSAYSHVLSEETTNILSDLFPSFRALSKAIHMPEGRALLEEYLGKETAREIIQFWQEDASRE